jgi:hypothetical protein
MFKNLNKIPIFTETVLNTNSNKLHTVLDIIPIDMVLKEDIKIYFKEVCIIK